jgi:hypothetical protein
MLEVVIMAKMTKAQVKKRLSECVSKLDNCVIKGQDHFTPAMRTELMKMSNRLLNMKHKMK